MALHEIIKGRAFALQGLFRSLKVGVGSPAKITGIFTGVAAVDPASVSANTTAETSVTITGVAVGDIVLFNIPTALETGITLAGSYVSATNTAKIRLTNNTAAPIDPASENWTYIWIKLT